MKRSIFVIIAVAGLGACDRPAADDCRKAIANMQRLLGTDAAAKNADTESVVRRCTSGSTRDAVACATKAGSLEELKACKFMETRPKR